jgi:hypothetical protein
MHYHALEIECDEPERSSLIAPEHVTGIVSSCRQLELFETVYT